jgi:TolB-like protein/DNA-binding winged helix-turn-helix (wHTH) protein
MASADLPTVVRFGEFEADLRSGELRKNGQRVRLQDQPFQVLAVLLARPGDLVKREELRQQVWPQNTFVEFDHALNTAIKKIRIALEDDAGAPRYVETIPKRGYRFVAEVRKVIDLPEPQTDAGSKAVEPGPARRWLPKTRTVVALSLTLLLSLVVVGIRPRTSPRESPGNRIVLAVLPFEDWSEGAKHASLCEGIAQELITQLGGGDSSGLLVVPRAACLRYRHSSKSIAEIGRELHADYLLEGNVRGDARQVRVTVELIRASDETRVWGGEFNREPGDSLALESELAAAIAGKIRSAIFSGPAR